MNELNGFYLNGHSSRNYGIIMTEPPKIVFAEEEVEPISVAGRSGDLVVSLGRYKNATIPYKCALLPEDDQSLREAAVYALKLLRPSSIYMRLENTYHPESYRMARISDQISITSIVEQAGTFTVNFDCKPQRFLKAGEHPITMSAAGSLWNPTGFPALPLITVYGSGAGTLTVGEVTVEIKSMEDCIIFDSDPQDAYRVAASGALENMNGNINAPDFPVLSAGEIPISWTGGITKVEIIPRWWTL